MAAEAIHIAAIGTFGIIVVVVIGVAIDDKIMRPSLLVISYRHAVVHGDVLDDAVRPAPCADTLRLCMSLDAYRHADDVEITQMNVVCTEIEGGKAVLAVEHQCGEVEHGSFAGIAHIACAMLCRTGFLKCEHEGIHALDFHHLAVCHVVCASTEAYGVAAFGQPVGCWQRG